MVNKQLLNILKNLLEEFLNEKPPHPWFPSWLPPNSPDPFTELEAYVDYFVGYLLRLGGWGIVPAKDKIILKEMYEPEKLDKQVFIIDRNLDEILYHYLYLSCIKFDEKSTKIFKGYIEYKCKLDILIMLVHKFLS